MNNLYWISETKELTTERYDGYDHNSEVDLMRLLNHMIKKLKENGIELDQWEFIN